MKFEKSFATLDEILNCQRSPIDKTCLGYSEEKETVKEDSTSSKQLSEGNTKSYGDLLKNPIKVEDNRREGHNVP
jgi:hypothetical protein